MTPRLGVGHALATAALIAPPLAVVAPLGLAPLIGLTAAGGFVLCVMERRRPPLPRALTGLAVALLGLALASWLWANQPALIWRDWPELALTTLAGVFLLALAGALAPAERARAGRWLLWGVALALALLAAEALSAALFERSAAAYFYVRRPFFPQVFNRSAAALALFVWPAAIVLARARGLVAAFALVAAAFAILTRFESGAALLAVALGTGVAIATLALGRPRALGLALALALVAGTALAPLVPHLPVALESGGRRDLSISVYHRLEIWRFTAERIAERPLLGWGFNAARLLPGGEAELSARTSVMPLHPHNAMLQLWLELGVAGAALGAGLMALAALGAGRVGPGHFGQTRFEPAFALALVAAGASVAALGYGIWQEWWMAALWLAAAFAHALVAPTPAAGR